MIDPVAGFFRTALKSLARHGADALLAFCLFAGFLFAPRFKVDQSMALVALALVWAVYHVRCVASERHKERMAEIAVDKLEKTRGRDVRSRQRVRLGRQAAKKAT